MVSNDLVDGFIPKNEMHSATCAGNKAQRSRSHARYIRTGTQTEASRDLPVLRAGTEHKVKEQEAWEVEVKKMVAEMVARAEEKKRRQREQGSAAD